MEKGMTMPNPDSRQKFADLDHGSGENADIDGAHVQQGEHEDGEETGEEQQDEPEKKYTDAELDTILQRKMARERQKIEKQVRESIAKENEDARTEAKKLEGMTELQRAQHEARMLREENDALKAEQNLSEQMAIARRELSSAGISLGDDLLSMFVGAEAEKTSAAIDRIKELWPKAINEAVQRELRRTPPDAARNAATKSYGASFAEKYSKKMIGGK